MNHPSISVVIPAYNCASFIEQTLKAASQQTYPGPVEIIVVDDGSSDDTAAKVKAFKQVKYLFQRNAGPAAARNKGAQESQGDLILFTDSDCLPREDWVEKTVSGFRAQDVAVVAGSYGIANKEYLLARCVYAEIMYRHNRLMPDFPRSFGSYNFCVRRKVFDAVGGFNEGYKHASGEDNDLSYKILKAGYKIYFARDSRVDHFHPTRFQKYMQEQWRHGFWRMKMYADHPNMAMGDDYTFWKDAVEMPLVFFILIGFFLSVLGLSYFFIWALSLMIVLFSMELFFSLRMLKSFKEIFFMSFVLFARAFSRFFGFSSGLFYFFRLF